MNQSHIIALALTPRELIECHKIPEVLQALADYHDCCETEADAIGDFEEAVQFHKARAAELRREADRLIKEI